MYDVGNIIGLSLLHRAQPFAEHWPKAPVRFSERKVVAW